MSYPEKTQSLTNEFVHVVVGTWCCVTESMGIFTAVLIIQNVDLLTIYKKDEQVLYSKSYRNNLVYFA